MRTDDWLPEGQNHPYLSVRLSTASAVLRAPLEDTSASQTAFSS